MTVVIGESGALPKLRPGGGGGKRGQRKGWQRHWQAGMGRLWRF